MANGMSPCAICRELDSPRRLHDLSVLKRGSTRRRKLCRPISVNRAISTQPASPLNPNSFQIAFAALSCNTPSPGRFAFRIRALTRNVLAFLQRPTGFQVGVFATPSATGKAARATRDTRKVALASTGWIPIADDKKWSQSNNQHSIRLQQDCSPRDRATSAIAC